MSSCNSAVLMILVSMSYCSCPMQALYLRSLDTSSGTSASRICDCFRYWLTRGMYLRASMTSFLNRAFRQCPTASSSLIHRELCRSTTCNCRERYGTFLYAQNSRRQNVVQHEDGTCCMVLHFYWPGINYHVLEGYLWRVLLYVTVWKTPTDAIMSLYVNHGYTLCVVTLYLQ